MNKKKFKKKHIKQNILLKENILTGKEDDEIFKEKKIFDIYGNILLNQNDQLKKKYILDEQKN